MGKGSTKAKQGWKIIVENGGSLSCGICGKTFKLGDSITLDHIIPRFLGGVHKRRNWQPAHYTCNQSKANKIFGGSQSCVTCDGKAYIEYSSKDGRFKNKWPCICVKKRGDNSVVEINGLLSNQRVRYEWCDFACCSI